MEQFLVVASVRTGHLLCPFDRMHGYIETLAGRPVWTHELGNQKFANELAEKSKPEFEALFQAIFPRPARGIKEADE